MSDRFRLLTVLNYFGIHSIIYYFCVQTCLFCINLCVFLNGFRANYLHWKTMRLLH